MNMRDAERASIYAFLLGHADKLTGRVLDFGCGRRPYEQIVKAAGGDYHGYDDPEFPASLATEDPGPDWPLNRIQHWDAIICTQVIQYLHDPFAYLKDFRNVGEVLLITGPTNWPVVEPEDLHRFTPKGIARLLYRAGFHGVDVVERHSVDFGGETWCLGWGAVAYA